MEQMATEGLKTRNIYTHKYFAKFLFILHQYLIDFDNPSSTSTFDSMFIFKVLRLIGIWGHP